ncbi:MAG: hypothetical protein HYV37_03250 [Candidatus Levyibacteriota bacterium]|nr:MAG: hypothetical protein HYV37_03250 [Candidatus Levybacteria bacterium]
MQEISTVTVNNFFTTINITFFIAGGTLGVFLTLITKFGSKFIDEYFNKREAVQKKKREFAKEVIAICTEGSTVGYNAMPGSQRHIHYIASQVEGLDKSIADDIRRYLGLWVLCAIRQTPGPYENKNPSKDDIEYCASLQRQAAVLDDSILERIRKWG